MKNKIIFVALTMVTIAPGMVAESASAQRYRHHSRHTYHGRNVYRRCDGGDGAVGTIAGGVGGAVIGNVLGGGTLGTIAGGVGGGLLGRHLDKQHTRHRRGC